MAHFELTEEIQEIAISNPMNLSSRFGLVALGMVCALAGVPCSWGYSVRGDTVTLEPSDQTEDNTSLIQGLLNSSAPVYAKIIVPAGPGNAPWKVRPLFFGHSDTSIELLSHAVLEAKPGGYAGANDCLLRASNLDNIRIVGQEGSGILMHLAEYATITTVDPKKGRIPLLAEWRHGLNFQGCRNVTLDSLFLKDAGGDAIYLGASPEKGYCSDITIHQVIVDGAGRNGLSVISVEGLHVSDSVFKNTAGKGNVAQHGPWAGIDIEPNSSANWLRNILVENCRFSNNTGMAIAISGWGMSHVSPKKGKSKAQANPVTITIKDCVVEGSHYGAGFSLDGYTYTGIGVFVFDMPAFMGSDSRILFERCVIKDNEQVGILIRGKARDGGSLIFANCYLENNGSAAGYCSISLGGTPHSAAPSPAEVCGNIQFANVTIRQPENLSAVQVPYCFSIDGTNGPVSDISGTVFTSAGELARLGPENIENVDLAISPWSPVGK